MKKTDTLAADLKAATKALYQAEQKAKADFDAAVKAAREAYNQALAAFNQAAIAE